MYGHWNKVSKSTRKKDQLEILAEGYETNVNLYLKSNFFMHTVQFHENILYEPSSYELVI